MWIVDGSTLECPSTQQCNGWRQPPPECHFRNNKSTYTPVECGQSRQRQRRASPKHKKQTKKKTKRNVYGKKIRENFFCAISFGIGKAFVCLFTLHNIFERVWGRGGVAMGSMLSWRAIFASFLLVGMCISYMDNCISLFFAIDFVGNRFVFVWYLVLLLLLLSGGACVPDGRWEKKTEIGYAYLFNQIEWMSRPRLRVHNLIWVAVWLERAGNATQLQYAYTVTSQHNRESLNECWLAVNWLQG